MRHLLLSAGLALSLAAAPNLASAVDTTTYHFYQDGWTGGGVATLTITIDTVPGLFVPGWVWNTIGGVYATDFSFNFTGNSILADVHTTTYADLATFSWIVNPNNIGLVSGFPSDGVNVNVGTFQFYEGPFSGQDCSGSSVCGQIFGYDGNGQFTLLESTNIMMVGTPAPVPEPASYALMGLGLAGLLALRRRR